MLLSLGAPVVLLVLVPVLLVPVPVLLVPVLLVPVPEMEDSQQYLSW
jgi:hypothetical protein